MQRYFLAIEGLIHHEYELTEKDDIHHIKNVMRNNAGDKIIINFTNNSFLCEILSVEHTVRIKTIEALNLKTELPVHFTIASGMLKADKYEWMLQKATELGAHAFIPFISERTVIKLDDKKVQKKIERFNKIVKEASEQSYRTVIPEIIFVKDSKQLSTLFDDFDKVIILFEESAKENEQKVFHKMLEDINAGEKVLLIFGPEGGLSESEINFFNQETAGLGPRILRAETAPLYALSAASFYLELMNQSI